LLKEYGSHVPGVIIIPGITNVITSCFSSESKANLITLGMKATPG